MREIVHIRLYIILLIHCNTHTSNRQKKMLAHIRTLQKRHINIFLSGNCSQTEKLVI